MALLHESGDIAAALAPPTQPTAFLELTRFQLCSSEAYLFGSYGSTLHIVQIILLLDCRIFAVATSLQISL